MEKLIYNGRMIALIAAVSKNGVIGAKGDLPWHIPEDLKHFRETTAGKTVVMGRKTFESIMARNGKPLPNRVNVVISRETDYAVPEGVRLFHSIDDAMAALTNQEIFIIGGGEIYRQTIDQADTLFITHVNQEIEGDAFFPEISPDKWSVASEEVHEGYKFVTYKRNA
jgi:dihydrofolate reductase